MRALITTWKASRSYGRVLRLKKRGERAQALNVASDALERALLARVRPSPPFLTVMFSLATQVAEIATEMGRTEASRPLLSRVVEYWEQSTQEQPRLRTFEPARQYIEFFRYRIQHQDAHGDARSQNLGH
jgi:hypothetical protein